METCLPEVLDNLIRFGIASVVGMLLPVVNIDVSYTTYQQLKLGRIKNVDEILRDELMESGGKGIELILHAFLDAPFSDKATTR